MWRALHSGLIQQSSLLILREINVHMWALRLLCTIKGTEY